ncbi:unnamed protein product [Protopolystoma xenopodis]|uniref:Uncharacterized protein n=1 Tax=Protopolystoma xenopodis TaxID=117903 RepID=A0A3S5BJZ5_9PLAT|nr:unnamed protein product [Protopolystoma xenopodis]
MMDVCSPLRVIENFALMRDLNLRQATNRPSLAENAGDLTEFRFTQRTQDGETGREVSEVSLHFSQQTTLTS